MSYELYNQLIWVWLPAATETFLSSGKTRIFLWPKEPLIWTGNSPVVTCQGVRPRNDLHLVSKLRIRGTVLLIPHTSSSQGPEFSAVTNLCDDHGLCVGSCMLIVVNILRFLQDTHSSNSYAASNVCQSVRLKFSPGKPLDKFWWKSVLDTSTQICHGKN